MYKFIVAAVPWGIALILHTCYSAAHYKKIIADLLQKGYEPASENSKDYLIVNKLIQNEEGRIYPRKKFDLLNNKSAMGVIAILFVFAFAMLSGKKNFTDYFLVFCAFASAGLGAFTNYQYNADFQFEHKKI